MATALMAMKMYHEAQQAYRTALRIEPNNEAVAAQLRAVDVRITAVAQQGGGAVLIPSAQDIGAEISLGRSATARTSPNPEASTALRPERTASLAAGGAKRDAEASEEEGGGKRQAVLAHASGDAVLHSAGSSKARVEELQQTGNAAFRAGECARAYLIFTEAIDVADQPNANLHANRSAVLCALMRFEEAIQDADLAIKLKPDWGRGHSRRANALHAMCKRGVDRWEDARRAYEAALELDVSSLHSPTPNAYQ